MNFVNKKQFKNILKSFILITIFIPNLVYATNYDSICYEPGVMNAMKIIGYVVMVCKWVVPLIIIIFGMMDYTKAVASNDDKALNKATAALIRRIVAGIFVFLIPTIIIAILNITVKTDIDVNNEKTTIGDTNFGKCTKCIFDPNNCNDSENKNGGGVGGNNNQVIMPY